MARKQKSSVLEDILDSGLKLGSKIKSVIVQISASTLTGCVRSDMLPLLQLITNM